METVLTTVGVIGGLCVAGITIVSFWMSFAKQIAAAGAAADKADSIAQDAKKDAHEANEKVGILGAAFSLHREQVAKEYIHRDVLGEFEDRLTKAIDRLGDRLDRILEKKN